jgi:hypothetical protein
MPRPKGNRESVRLSVIIDADEYAQIGALAARHDVSIAWVIRLAVRELLSREQKATPDTELPLPGQNPIRRWA